MRERFENGVKNVLCKLREGRPLVHHITNYVTVNDCANIVLAAGASPVMSDEIEEVGDIVAISSALVLNIGTLNKRTIEAMLAAGKMANERGIPVVLDPVGAGATPLRTRTAERLISEVKFAVIRGNLSEVKAICGFQGITKGVDASDTDAINENSVKEVESIAAGFARDTGSIVAVTGVIDVVSDGSSSCFIRNGHAMMAGVTGTGCMCTSLIAALCGTMEDYGVAAAAAVMTMGLAGERAFHRVKQDGLGTGSYRTFIIDEVSTMRDEDLISRGRINFGAAAD